MDTTNNASVNNSGMSTETFINLFGRSTKKDGEKKPAVNVRKNAINQCIAILDKHIAEGPGEFNSLDAVRLELVEILNRKPGRAASASSSASTNVEKVKIPRVKKEKSLGAAHYFIGVLPTGERKEFSSASTPSPKTHGQYREVWGGFRANGVQYRMTHGFNHNVDDSSKLVFANNDEA